MLPKYATPDEVASLLAHLEGVPKVAAMLMYGSGTRIAETMALRLKDISLTTRELHVRAGKGGKDRTTLIAEAAVPLLREQMRTVEEIHTRDLERGAGWAPLPAALHRKDPRAGWDLGWQYLFPASLTTVDERPDAPAADTSTRPPSNERSRKQPERRRSRAPSVLMCFDTASPPRSSEPGATYASSRGSWATAISRPPRSTCTSSTGPASASSAHSIASPRTATSNPPALPHDTGQRSTQQPNRQRQPVLDRDNPRRS
jgi:hypothetical protein